MGIVQPRVWAALAVLGTLAPNTAKEEPLIWGAVRLPGSVSAARHVLGLDSSTGRPDASGLLDLARFAHSNASSTRTVDVLGRYLTTVDDLETAVQTLHAGLVLPSSSTPKKEREGVQKIVELLGLRLRERRGAYTLEIEATAVAAERSAWVSANGLDVKQILSSVSVDKPIGLHVTDAELPLPLPDFWQHEVFTSKHLPILDIITDRQSSLFYVGLMALDDETLGFLAGHLPLLRHLREDQPGTFAAFGRSIRIHSGIVDVPGGPTAAVVWESLIGRAATDPERFVRDLLAQDNGRLAYFYDLVDHLDRAHQAFVLGTSLDVKPRERFVKHVYDLFPVTAEWSIPDRPFYRPAFDGAVPLSFIGITAEGDAGPSWWPSIFEQATGGSDWPSRADRRQPEIKDRPADAACVLEWIFRSPKDTVARFQLLRFAQRALAGSQRQEALAVEQALRTWFEMPALGRALERMRVTDPSVFGSVGTAAHQLTQAGGIDNVRKVVARWQAALGLLEQADRLHPEPAEKTAKLLRSLAAITPKAHEGSAGALAAWVADELAPAFATVSGDLGDLEHTVVAALAGAPTATTPTLSWEGLDYVIDVAGTVLKQVTAIRQAQHGPRLQDLVALEHVRHTLAQGVATVDQLKSVVAELTRLEAAVAAVPQVDGKPDPLVHEYRDTIADLAKITRTQDLKRTSRALPVIARTLTRSTTRPPPHWSTLWPLLQPISRPKWSPPLGRPTRFCLRRQPINGPGRQSPGRQFSSNPSRKAGLLCAART